MYGRLGIGILLAAGLSAAQKPTIGEHLRGGTAGQQLRDELGLQGSAGPGYIQKEFLKSLQKSLGQKLGAKRASELTKNLKGQNLKPQEVMNLLNGKIGGSQLGNMCGAKKSESEEVEAAVEEAVKEKDRKCFFGILIIVLVCECKCEDGDFLKQACKGMEKMEGADADRLMRGDVSSDAIQHAFGFGDKAMCKEMQEALNKTRSSPLANHPMCESMGMGQKGKFKPEDFPKPEEGMPGCGGEFADGEAGGLPFDGSLPPLPYAGENMGMSCCCCCCGEGGEPPAEGSGDAPTGG